jgi:hypothetical protein
MCGGPKTFRSSGVNRRSKDLETKVQFGVRNTGKLHIKACITFDHRYTKVFCPLEESTSRGCWWERKDRQSQKVGRAEEVTPARTFKMLFSSFTSSFLHNILLSLRIIILRPNNPTRDFASFNHPIRGQLSLRYHTSSRLFESFLE